MESNGLVTAIERQKPTQWRLCEGVAAPRFDPIVGLASLLVKEESLRHLVPAAANVLHDAIAGALSEVGPIHEERWRRRVRMCPSPLTLAPVDIRPEILRTVLGSLFRDRLVAIDENVATASSAFFLPVGLLIRPGLWTVLLRDDRERVHAIPIHRLGVVRVGESMPHLRGTFDLDAHLKARIPSTKAPLDSETILALDRTLAPLEASARMGRADGDRSVVRVPLTDWRDVAAFVLDCGDAAEVLAPQDFREIVARARA